MWDGNLQFEITDTGWCFLYADNESEVGMTYLTLLWGSHKWCVTSVQVILYKTSFLQLSADSAEEIELFYSMSLKHQRTKSVKNSIISRNFLKLPFNCFKIFSIS